MNKLKVIAPALEELLKTKVDCCVNFNCPHNSVKHGGCSLKNISIRPDGQCHEYKLTQQQTKEEKK